MCVFVVGVCVFVVGVCVCGRCVFVVGVYVWGCMCVILYFYTATCGPKGHGSGGFFQKDLFLSPIEMINPSGATLPPDGEAVIVGVSQRLLLPITARESKKRERTKQRKKKTHSVWSSPSPTPPSPLERARTLARPPPRPNPPGRRGPQPRATCSRETLRPLGPPRPALGWR